LQDFGAWLFAELERNSQLTHLRNQHADAEAVCCALTAPDGPAGLQDFARHFVSEIAAEVRVEPTRQTDLLRCLFNPFASAAVVIPWTREPW
jgi:hypothetical protein